MPRGKQYDRNADDWSIGCIDERDADTSRMAWTPDGPTRPAPIRDARRRHVAGRQYAGHESHPGPRNVVKARPALTLTQRAVRDYRRAWRRISA